MLGTLEEDLQKIEDMEDSAEFQIKLQALRKKMLEIKRWSTAKYLVPFFLILMPRLIGRDSMILCFILIGSGLLFYYLKYHKMPEFFSNMESLQDVYAKEVLEPLLQNFYPDLTVEKKGIALEDVVRFTPKSQKYLQDFLHPPIKITDYQISDYLLLCHFQALSFFGSPASGLVLVSQ